MADNYDGYTLVTGASSGLGAGIANRLSRTRKLLLHGRSIERLAQVQKNCFSPDSHVIWAQDLSQPDRAARNLASRLLDTEISVTEFIHSAGNVSIGSLRQMNPEAVEGLFAVNVCVAMCFVPVLLRAGSLTSVVFVSSAASLCGEKGVVAYAASKGAINSLTRSLAVELAPAVRVNAVLPGLVDTPMSQPTLSTGAIANALARLYPLGFGETDDVVNVVEFLLSPQAKWITGQCVVVDGGRTLV